MRSEIFHSLWILQFKINIMLYLLLSFKNISHKSLIRDILFIFLWSIIIMEINNLQRYWKLSFVQNGFHYLQTYKKKHNIIILLYNTLLLPWKVKRYTSFRFRSGKSDSFEFSHWKMFMSWTLISEMNLIKK